MNVLLIGLGRIGKLVARKLASQDERKLEWVGAVERVKDPALFSYLLNYDSTYGSFNPKIGHTADSFKVENQGDVPFFDDVALAINETTPDLVIDCSGSHQSADLLISIADEKSKHHLFAQALDVVKQASDTKVWVFGVNDHDFNRRLPRNIINPGCLNNCLIPLISCLSEQFKITKGSFVSVHSVTNTQPSLDRAQHSPRWSRASGSNLIPAPHDNMGLINKFFPELEGQLIGRTVRAPVDHTSYLTCSFEVSHRIDRDSVLSCLANTKIAPTVLGMDVEPLVSSDYVTDPRSCVIDGTSVRVIDGSTIFLSAWYNNEYAFASRMIDIASKINETL
ncbi:MAG: aldehyde dehydrogenase [Litoricola sp.]|nr:aldehyde dehydrogenase [Litorivicinus sp.]